LRETLRAAAEAQEFTASDLAARLNLQPTTVNQRLAALLASGAVARTRDQAERGVRYRYRTPASVGCRGPRPRRPRRVARAKLAS
jgi:predicted transcriptional regulator